MTGLETAVAKWSGAGLVACAVFAAAPAFSAVPGVYGEITDCGSVVFPTGTVDRDEVYLLLRRSKFYVDLCRGGAKEHRYPVAVGRRGHETPLGVFRVFEKEINPAFVSPITGARHFGGAPGNPLVARWIGFTVRGGVSIGFHGTLDQASIGTAASLGCLRMSVPDVKALFDKVEVGTVVVVVP